MNIKPLADRVLILPAAAEEKTIGGIIIPDTAKEKPLSGTELEVEGEKYLIMRQSDVLAVVEK